MDSGWTQDGLGVDLGWSRVWTQGGLGVDSDVGSGVHTRTRGGLSVNLGVWRPSGASLGGVWGGSGEGLGRARGIAEDPAPIPHRVPKVIKV